MSETFHRLRGPRIGAEIKVCINPSSASKNRKYLHGTVCDRALQDGQVVYRVSHSSPWGKTSSWFNDSHVINYINKD